MRATTAAAAATTNSTGGSVARLGQIPCEYHGFLWYGRVISRDFRGRRKCRSTDVFILTRLPFLLSLFFSLIYLKNFTHFHYTTRKRVIDILVENGQSS